MTWPGSTLRTLIPSSTAIGGGAMRPSAIPCCTVGGIPLWLAHANGRNHWPWQSSPVPDQEVVGAGLSSEEQLQWPEAALQYVSAN